MVALSDQELDEFVRAIQQRLLARDVATMSPEFVKKLEELAEISPSLIVLSQIPFSEIVRLSPEKHGILEEMIEAWASILARYETLRWGLRGIQFLLILYALITAIHGVAVGSISWSALGDLIQRIFGK